VLRLQYFFRYFANELKKEFYFLVEMYATIKALFNNAEERRSSELKYLDISLTELDDGFQMTIKDCGRPYDPVANGMDAASFGARSASLHVYHECYNDSMG
jgi:hypothetical protein